MNLEEAAKLGSDTASELKEVNLGEWTATTMPEGGEFKPVLVLGRVWQLFPHVIGGEVQAWSCSSQQALQQQIYGSGETPAEAISKVRNELQYNLDLYTGLLQEFPR